DALLKQHPDYRTILTGDPRSVFLAAAVWPDTIKGDPRFWDDTRADAVPTPLIPGFPDMKRHTNCHYFATPYAPAGADAHEQRPPHAMRQLPRMIADPSTYNLPWIEHVTGDLHQPLHCVSRFLKSQPNGDAGGNFVIVGERRNLHAFWDDLAGSDTTDEYVAKYAAEAVAAHPRPKKVEKDVKKWISEGFLLAKSDVYTFGNETGSREHPLQLPAGYVENAQKVAQAQIAKAGYRLAAVLNDKLR